MSQGILPACSPALQPTGTSYAPPAMWAAKTKIPGKCSSPELQTSTVAAAQPEVLGSDKG